MNELVLLLKHNKILTIQIVRITYSILHHARPLSTYGLDGIKHIGHVLSLQAVMTQHQGTKCSSTPHTITKTDNVYTSVATLLRHV